MPENNQPSFEDLYQELEESCRELFLAEKPYLERRTLLRNQCKELGLYVPDGDFCTNNISSTFFSYLFHSSS